MDAINGRKRNYENAAAKKAKNKFARKENKIRNEKADNAATKMKIDAE